MKIMKITRHSDNFDIYTLNVHNFQNIPMHDRRIYIIIRDLDILFRIKDAHVNTYLFKEYI